MGWISQYGAYRNIIENKEKLRFARQHLSKKQFEQLYRSYKQLYWFQISSVIIFIVVIVLEAIFVPGPWTAEDPGMATMKTTALIFTAGFFCVPIFPIWLIISQFAVGKLWHKYSKWYKKESSMNELYQMFE